MSTNFVESQLEEAALEWFEELGYEVVFGPDISPDGDYPEREDYQQVILTPGRYVGIEDAQDDGEPVDEKMTRLTGELAELFAKSHKLEDEIRQRLGAIGYEL